METRVQSLNAWSGVAEYPPPPLNGGAFLSGSFAFITRTSVWYPAEKSQLITVHFLPKYITRLF